MRKPVVQVIGQSGRNLVESWGSDLIAVRFTDNEGGEADEIEIDFPVSSPFPGPPAAGTRYRLSYGWEGGGLRDAGLFTYQNARLTPSPGSGWTMTIVARSAHFVEADKSADSEHFEETTAGDIFKRLASDVGKAAKVHSSIGAVEIHFRLRYQQSPLGFAQALADELGASLKPANGQWLVTMKNSGETASGSTMPPIIIDASEIMHGTELMAEERPRHGEIQAGFFDPEKGVSLLQSIPGLGGAARFLALHPAASATEAVKRGEAEALDLARATITGTVVVEGRPEAMAGAPVSLTGFGAWSAFGLVTPTISHEFTFDESGGWLMTLECAAKT